ncbi:receptor-type tyrosine-protein phosphatase alpha-like [Ostrea edulis]|uniref:receptor-type tyrosine-protein phosphatase alpha-like n=1 Tax=Ostrea edulis TaxID=37623 RepID=UPI0024AFC475|nr:receptor-type tyrosine-protein phosphatase alpha-like [Ostrea edulis]
MTQAPLSDTEVDVWRLCMDHEIDAMVVLHQLDEENKWLPGRGSSLSCPPFTVTIGNTGSRLDDVNQDRLVISNNEQTRRMDIYQVPFESDTSVLKGVELLLETEKNPTFTFVVISKDSAGPTGIFCVLHNALQQLRIDGEVDIFTTVRQLQIRRTEVITKLEEYKRCYQLVSQSTAAEGIYANM